MTNQSSFHVTEAGFNLPLALSQQAEQLLVRKNLRGMAQANQALPAGYVSRAAALLLAAINKPNPTVLIGTGFPVAGTFETDGPVGAFALYHMLKQLGGQPVLVCGDPLFSAIAQDYQCEQLTLAVSGSGRASELLSQYQPAAVIAIERPGQAADGCYYNMRRENITAFCADFDSLVRQASCPVIAIGDGGNEIGMGNIAATIAKLDIIPAQTRCTELVVADVSNWASYAFGLCWSLWTGQNLLPLCDAACYLSYLSERGSVDGVTRLNTLTEDGLPLSQGQQLLAEFAGLLQANAAL